MRFCKKCEVNKPYTGWRMYKSNLNGKYYYRTYCNQCLNRIRNVSRGGISYKEWRKNKNAKYYYKDIIKQEISK